MRQRQWTVIKTTLVVLFALDMAFGSGPLLLPWAGVVPLLAAVLLRDLLVGRAALKAAVSGLVCAGLAALILASEDLGPSRVLFVAAVGIIGAVIPLQRRREAALLEEVNRLADEAQQGRQLLEAILDHSPVVIAAVSKDPLEWVFGRDRFRELSGLDDTCCPPGQELSRLHPFDQGFLDGGGAVGRSDQRSLFRIRDCTDRYRWIECRWLPQVPVPVFGGYVLSFRDVSAEIEAGTAGELLDDF